MSDDDYENKDKHTCWVEVCINNTCTHQVVKLFYIFILFLSLPSQFTHINCICSLFFVFPSEYTLLGCLAGALVYGLLEKNIVALTRPQTSEKEIT